MTSYHAGPDGIRAGAFLSADGAREVGVALSARERHFKARLFDCYATQRHLLREWFPIGAERFRTAPRYRFTDPPHEGRLWYERFPWGATGAGWRAAAAQALRELELEDGRC